MEEPTTTPLIPLPPSRPRLRPHDRWTVEKQIAFSEALALARA